MEFCAGIGTDEDYSRREDKDPDCFRKEMADERCWGSAHVVKYFSVVDIAPVASSGTGFVRLQPFNHILNRWDVNHFQLSHRPISRGSKWPRRYEFDIQ